MPYPSQISAEAILKQAITMIEADGVESLSMNKLAAALGVKASSLYRYFKNKAELLRAVNSDTVSHLFDALDKALDLNAEPKTQLLEGARYYRAFAFENAASYGLLFTNTIDDLRPDEDENLRRILPYQALISKICGDDHSLDATRGFLALMHGFVMLEISQQLRRGGDLDAAFEASVAAYIAGWENAPR